MSTTFLSHEWDDPDDPDDPSACVHCFFPRLDSGHHVRGDECPARLRAELNARSGGAQHLAGLLVQARHYLDGSRDPDTHLEGRLAAGCDRALAQLVSSYRPPARVMGRKHLEPVEAWGSDVDLTRLPDSTRALVASLMTAEDAGDICYGFALRGRAFLLRAPVEPVPLRRIPTPEPGVTAFVGPQVQFVPVFSFQEAPVQVGKANGEQLPSTPAEEREFSDTLLLRQARDTLSALADFYLDEGRPWLEGERELNTRVTGVLRRLRDRVRAE